MATVPSPAEYGAAVRTSFFWAASTLLVAVVLALPLVLSGPWLLAQSLFMPASFEALAGGLLLSSVSGLFLYALFRCVVLTTAMVRRRPGYPIRHWWFVQRACRSILLTELVILTAGSVVTSFAVFGNGRLAERAVVVAAIVDGGFFLVLMLALLGLNDALRHARVVPYFPRNVGGIDTYAEGESLARRVAELDKVADFLGVTPLSSFGWNDDMEHEPLVWHETSDGLKTVNALLAFLESDQAAWDDHSGMVADLMRIAHALSRANAQGIPFTLLLLHSKATSATEWETRRGTCF